MIPVIFIRNCLFRLHDTRPRIALSVLRQTHRQKLTTKVTNFPSPSPRNPQSFNMQYEFKYFLFPNIKIKHVNHRFKPVLFFTSKERLGKKVIFIC